MILDLSTINVKAELSKPEKIGKIQSLESSDLDDELVAEFISRPEQLGRVIIGRNKHYYSSGAFDLVQLVLYVLKQTGPAHVLLASYSVGDRTITRLKHCLEEGEILSIRFLIDNRVRTISPKPFDHMLTAFPGCVRCRTLHAKVALIWRDRFCVDIVGSQNATHNPKLERGTIFTNREVFNFDKKVLLYEFDRAAVEESAGNVIPAD